jgi:hypothetical protein
MDDTARDTARTHGLRLLIASHKANHSARKRSRNPPLDPRGKLRAMIRLIDDRELEDRLHALLDEEAGLARAKGHAAFRRWLQMQPEACLVGATAAARILRIPAPHIARYRKRGRMPAPLPVDGGYPVYLKGEVEMLARELESERRARAAKREAQ